MTETVERCPICRRQLGTNPPTVVGCCYVHLFEGDEGTAGAHRWDCYERGVSIRDAELASLRERERLEPIELPPVDSLPPLNVDPDALPKLREHARLAREERELETAVVEAAVDYVGSLDAGTPLDRAIDALVAHRQRNNDGNR